MYKDVVSNGIQEADAKKNSVTSEGKVRPRMGRSHQGAKELANLYSRG